MIEAIENQFGGIDERAIQIEENCFAIGHAFGISLQNRPRRRPRPRPRLYVPELDDEEATGGRRLRPPKTPLKSPLVQGGTLLSSNIASHNNVPSQRGTRLP